MEQKKHCIKAELQINADNEEIISCVVEKGNPHDFTIFKRHEIEIEEKIEILADSGYQGLQKIHANCKIPFKKTKLKKLTEEQKTYNKELSQERIKIEHTNRQCKIFRIVKDVYRGKKKHSQNIWEIICGIVNLKNSKLKKVQII
jgi:IS5 family transposase